MDIHTSLSWSFKQNRFFVVVVGAKLSQFSIYKHQTGHWKVDFLTSKITYFNSKNPKHNMPSFYWKWLLLIQALLSAADLDRLNQCFLSMLFFCCPLAPFYWDKKAKSRGRRGWGSSHCSSVMWTLCEVCSVCMCIPLSFYWPSSRETTRAGGERMVWLVFTKSQWEHQAVRWLHGEGEQQTTHHTTPQGFNWMVQTDLWLKKIVSKFTMSISLHAPLNYFSHHKVCLNVFLFNLFFFFLHCINSKI